MMKTALTNDSPAEYDAMPGSTVNVVQYDRLILGRDVFNHFQR